MFAPMDTGRRNSSTLRQLALSAGALLSLALSGCSIAPHTTRIELEHISHPLSGRPFGPRFEEDSLNQLNVLGRWRRGRIYVEQGLGYNLRGRHGGGFYGPGLTYTGRVGIEFDRCGR
jgi:hypothetical protein